MEEKKEPRSYMIMSLTAHIILQTECHVCHECQHAELDMEFDRIRVLNPGGKVIDFTKGEK